MQFPPSLLDKIRESLSASEIVGSRVKLNHKGGGEYTGLCPFHQEKTPSFTVSDRKGFYHCFGCGAHGDIIKFTMETQGLNFPDSVKSLASNAGIAMPEQNFRDTAKYEKIKSLYDVTEAATMWFSEALQKNTEAQQYLSKRAVGKNIIAEFRLGYAPKGRNSLAKAMIAKGFSKKQLEDVGLILKGKNNEYYDRFRGRVIFPILDIKDRVIAFGGRILGDGQPKYLNSPETSLFHKGNVLYAMNLARQEAYDKGNIIVVEGYMDVIALHSAGIKNAVAPLGTAITEKHIKTMWKTVKEPTICLDGDKAGKRAMVKTAINCTPYLKAGYSLKFAMLPSEQDPDDAIKNNGVAFLHDVINEATTLSEILWQSALSELNINSFSKAPPEQKAALENRVMEIAENIEDKIVSNYYRQYFKSKIWESGRSSYKKSFTAPNEASDAMKNTTLKKETSNLAKHEITLLMTLVNNPQILQEDEQIFDIIMHIDFSDNTLKNIQTELINIIGENEELTREEIINHLEKKGFSDYIKQISSNIFIEHIARQEVKTDVALSGWKYTHACIDHAATEEEYNNSVNASQNQDDDIHQKLFELKKQRDLLKKLVEKEKMLYDAALDD